MTVLAATHASPATLERAERDRLLVRFWLYAVLAVMFALFIVGGATRLSDAGLSITEWKPIHGLVPPMSQAQWREEFDKYKQIPEYRELNRGMSLGEFKTIFWWEYLHRVLARGVGVLFALPLAYFWLSGRIESGLGLRLTGLLLLGALQGAIGWWMVSSGLAERTDVSQYRLATHLLMACIIFAATMAVARGLAPHSAGPAGLGTRAFAGALVVLVLAQIYLGGLVAGVDGGMSYNTWPLMDGRLVPPDLFVVEPAWRNFFENPKLVQFTHRCGAYVLLLAALAHMIATSVKEPGTTHARRAALLFALVLLQAAVGVAALVMQVPYGIALAHQAMAIVVLGFAVAHWRGTKGSYLQPARVQPAL